MAENTDSPLQRSSLAALRSVLVGLAVVGAFGIVAVLVSYRADVDEARRQVRTRLEHRGRVYADSLALHFDLLHHELQHLGDGHAGTLRAKGADVLLEVRDDRSLFGAGVTLLQLDGRALWSEPADDERLVALHESKSQQPWFQRVLESDRVAVDAWAAGEARIAVAVPVREHGRLAAVLVGIVEASDRLLFAVESPNEKVLLLSSGDQVVLPQAPPAFTQARDFSGHLDGLRNSPSNAGTWVIDGDEHLAQIFAVSGTSLAVLVLESEGTSIAPIRARLNVQLAFLLFMQVFTLGAFFLFLRRTWRVFVEVEERIAQQEKLAALGAAASLIAHEVKNSLNGLKGAVSLLQSGGEATLVSRTVKGQVDRLGHLASSLLSFSRRSETRAVPMQLDAVARETVEALQSLPEFAEAQLVLDLEPKLDMSSDPLLLMSAVDNLVRNAIEAAVAAKDVGRIETPRVSVSVRREGARLVLSVEDNAGGPSEGFERHLGEPFFTTKPRGIGLGLTMTKRAVEQLGGELCFERTAQGSRFSLRFGHVAAE